MTLDIVTVVLLIAFAFLAGLMTAYVVLAKHFTREAGRLADEIWRLRG